LIPEAVFHKVVTQGKTFGIAEASIVEEAVDRWIFREEIRPEISSEYGFLDENERIGLGERQALKLCKQLNAHLFIVDNKEARRVARILKIKTLGTFGILIQARRQGLVSSEEAEDIPNELVKAGFRIDPILYCRLIKELSRP
jgi:predicted nucleic acid-binding protein